MGVRQSKQAIGPSATFDSATLAGSTLVAILGADPSGLASFSLADGKGNSTTGTRKVSYDGGGGVTSLSVWVLENIANAGSGHSLTVSGIVNFPDFATLTVYEIDGAPASSYDSAVTATRRDTDGTPYTLTTGAPSQAGDIIVAAITSEGSSNLNFSASGWTRDQQQGDFTQYWGQADFSKTATTGTQSFSATATGGSSTMVLAAVGIKQGASSRSATATQSLTGVAQSAAVSGQPRASASQTLAAAAQSAAARAVAGVVVAQSLASASTAATASAQGGVAAAQALASAGQTATAAAQDRVSVAQTLQAAGQSSTAAAVGSASAAQILAAVSQAATSSAAAGATSARTLAGVNQAAASVGIASVAAAQQLQGVSQAAGAGAVPSGIVAAQKLAAVSQGATAAARANASAAQVLVAAVNSAAAAAIDAVEAAQQLAGVTQAATAEKAAQVVAAQILEAVGQSAEAQQIDVRAVSAAQALANVVQLALMQPGGAPEPVYGVVPPGRQRTYPSRPAVTSGSRPANIQRQGRPWLTR